MFESVELAMLEIKQMSQLLRGSLPAGYMRIADGKDPISIPTKTQRSLMRPISMWCQRIMEACTLTPQLACLTTHSSLVYTGVQVRRMSVSPSTRSPFAEQGSISLLFLPLRGLHDAHHILAICSLQSTCT